MIPDRIEIYEEDVPWAGVPFLHDKSLGVVGSRKEANDYLRALRRMNFLFLKSSLESIYFILESFHLLINLIKLFFGFLLKLEQISLLVANLLLKRWNLFLKLFNTFAEVVDLCL